MLTSFCKPNFQEALHPACIHFGWGLQLQILGHRFVNWGGWGLMQ